MVPHSHGSRPAILAHRPAPIQVNYGSGRLFARVHHSSITSLRDRWTLPFVGSAFFSEKVAYTSAQLVRTTTPRTDIRTRIPTRAEEGLPERRFRILLLQRSYKITPEFFAIWMRVLREIDGSVLWLARNNDFAVANLRRAASEAGSGSRAVSSLRKCGPRSRIIWRGIVSPICSWIRCHITRRLTAMDALWAGLPVLTCAGRSFAGRARR